MKIPVLCNVCVSAEMLGEHQYLMIEPRADGIYKTTCARGHEVSRLLDEEHFQVLFEYGVSALRDGYLREAIASFAASLERFHEYAVRVLVAASGVEGSSADAAWRLVSKMSERQFGAFVYLFLSGVGKMPHTLGGTFIELRNNVIHKGHFPTKAEANRYGDEVKNTIVANYSELDQKFSRIIYTEKVKRQRAYLEKLDTDAVPVYFGIAMTLNFPAPAAP